MKSKGPLRRVGIEAGLLLGCALVPCLAAAWLHPRRAVWIEPVAAAETRVESMDEPGSLSLRPDEVTLSIIKKWPEPPVWIDARSRKQYTQGHVPGAFNLSEARWEAGLFAVLDKVTSQSRVVVYCGSERCGSSQAVAARLREEAGLESVYVFQGGWDAWLREQKP